MSEYKCRSLSWDKIGWLCAHACRGDFYKTQDVVHDVRWKRHLLIPPAPAAAGVLSSVRRVVLS